jgi:hypothetical protein
LIQIFLLLHFLSFMVFFRNHLFEAAKLASSNKFFSQKQKDEQVYINMVNAITLHEEAIQLSFSYSKKKYIYIYIYTSQVASKSML